MTDIGFLYQLEEIRKRLDAVEKRFKQIPILESVFPCIDCGKLMRLGEYHDCRKDDTIANLKDELARCRKELRSWEWKEARLAELEKMSAEINVTLDNIRRRNEVAQCPGCGGTGQVRDGKMPASLITCKMCLGTGKEKND